MILGISGKIQSGKDTIGNIIQYFTSTRTYGRTCEEYITAKDNQYYKGYSNWEIRKFADKLKDIVCILIGCTRDQLEDNEFKNKQLGEEWTKYYFISIAGIKYKYYNTYDEALNECPKHFHYIEKEILTPRKLLQTIGTDCGRNIVHPDIWINALFTDYKPIAKSIPNFRSPDDIDDMPAEYPNWIITDVRFPNEVEAIKSRGGIIIRVNRPDFEYVSIGEERIKLDVEFSVHESETALDGYTNWDHVINNDSTLENLIKKVELILQKEKVI